MSLVVCGALPARAIAADVGGQSSFDGVRPAPANDPAPRSAILLGIAGDLTPERRAMLQQLLEGELSGLRPRRALEVTATGSAAREWIASARRDPGAFLIVALDLHEAGSWRVYLIDAARDHAILRQFPGEAAGNSAALETVVSVVSSAVRALDEGLEIASRPVADVTGEPAPSKAPPLDFRALPSVPMVRRWQLALGLGSALTTLESNVTVTLGMFGSVRLVSASGLSFRACVVRNWPAHFESEFGDFELHRTRGALGMGAEVTEGGWQFSVEAGPALELLQRRVLAAGPGARSRQDTDSVRAGAELSLGTRYRVSNRFALALAFEGAYFPQQVRYTLVPETNRVLAAPWRATGSVQLGLEFWLIR